MTKKRKKKEEQHKIFNSQILIFLFISVAFLVTSIVFWADDLTVAIFLLVLSLITLSGVFLLPINFIFTNKQLKLVWLLPFEKIIFWSSVTVIIENKFYEAIDDLANYQIMYKNTYKGESIIKEVQIPLNKKTKVLIDKYAKYKIL